MFIVLISCTFVFAQAHKELVASNSADFHIGIVTGTVSQSEDDLRGAEKLIEEYGTVAHGGIIQHMAFPDDFMDESETTISDIASLAYDPKMKAIIVNEAIPGTTEAFREIKERRPDILCFAAEAHEDLPLIGSAADLVCSSNFVASGYLNIRTAHELGCDTFIHISFPRHMSYEVVSRSCDIMKAACEEMGIKFVLESAPDPTSDVGVAGAQQFILEQVPTWIEKYGKNTAFFCTNDAHIEPLVKQLLTYGGYFFAANSPLEYLGALEIDLSKEAGNFAAILDKVEEIIVQKGGANRFGTCSYSNGFTHSVALGQHAINCIKGESKVNDLNDLIEAFGKFCPGAKWNGSVYIDAATEVKHDNVLLLYQDTYVMGGKGYMGNTEIEIPEEYITIR